MRGNVTVIPAQPGFWSGFFLFDQIVWEPVIGWVCEVIRNSDAFDYVNLATAAPVSPDPSPRECSILKYLDGRVLVVDEGLFDDEGSAIRHLSKERVKGEPGLIERLREG